jgi:dUTP pyrophosphatase
MKEINVKILVEEDIPIPRYESDSASGLDLRANLKKADNKISGKKYNIIYDDKGQDYIILQPNGRVLIPTGIRLEIPVGFEAQIRPRSGLALNKGITIANTPGTIDADYRGEIGIILINLSNEDFTIKHGDRIAQLILNEVVKIHWSIVEKLEETSRGEGGFGHTGIK